MIFTIGYSNRSLPEFLKELAKRDIRQLWDVRSTPRSRNVAFNKTQIVQWSERAGIYYLNCGEVLGGHSQFRTSHPAYADSLNQLIIAAKRENIAIMCAEGDPALCHRTWDIGASLLLDWEVPALKILRSGDLEHIKDTIKRVRSGNFASEILAKMERQQAFDWPQR